MAIAAGLGIALGTCPALGVADDVGLGAGGIESIAGGVDSFAGLPAVVWVADRMAVVVAR